MIQAPVTRKKDSRTSKAQVAKGTDRERGRSSKSSIKRPRSPSADREEAETAIGSRKVSAQQKSTNVSEPASKRPKKQRDTSRADSADDKTEQSDEEVAASLAPRRADGKTKAHNPSSRDKARRAKNASSRHDEEDSYGESAADSNDSDVVEVAVSKEPVSEVTNFINSTHGLSVSSVRSADPDTAASHPSHQKSILRQPLSRQNPPNDPRRPELCEPKQAKT